MPGGPGISVKLERRIYCGVLPPWGFRIHGGKDFSHSLTVLRVTPGSIADRCGLWNGDVIEQINGKDATNLIHLEAQQLIKVSGEQLELVVERQGTTNSATDSNDAKSSVTKPESEEPGVNGTLQTAQEDKVGNDETDSATTSPDQNVSLTAENGVTADTNNADGALPDTGAPSEQVDATDVEVEITISKGDARSPSPADEPPPLPRSPIPDFHVRPAPVEHKSTIPAWMEPRSEPAMGRTMKLLQRKLSVGETAPSVLDKSASSSPESTLEKKPSEPRPFASSTPQLLQDEGEEKRILSISKKSQASVPSNTVEPSAEAVPEKTPPEPKPFVSSTLQLLQEEEEERKKSGAEKLKPRHAPSNSMETPGDPPLGRTMRLLQQQLKLGGDAPLPSVLSPDYSKTHARPRSWGQLGRPSTIIKAPTPRETDNRQSPDPVSKPPEPVNKPSETAKPDTAKPNVGPNYRYYAGLTPTPDKKIEPTQVGRRRSSDFEKKRTSIDSSGTIGQSKVFDTWTGVWKDPEPTRLGTYQHTDQTKPAPSKAPAAPNVTSDPPKTADTLDGPVNGEPGKPSCASCHQTIKGAFVTAVSKTWCPDHFCCHYCKINLSETHFVEEDGKIYCQEDYELLFSPRCATCNETIFGHAINAIGKSYHPPCFVCAKCKKPFEGDGFMLEQGEPYCQKDYDALFAVRCGKCEDSITGGERYIEALGKEWHIRCFACSVCRTQLEGTKFFVVNGAPYCQDHKGMKR